MTPLARLVSAVVAAAAATVLGVLAAWPIYQTPWLLAPAAAGLGLGAGLAWAGWRLRWAVPVRLAAAVAAFALTLLPVAMPQALLAPPAQWLPALADALAAVVLGWKQLLTLTLPVGTYQTVLVPAYAVFFITAFAGVWIALRSPRVAPFAALPFLLPVAFGTVFGAAELSAPLRLGPMVVTAPREVALWAAACALGGGWVVWRAGARRRRALRLGRAGRSTPGRGAWARGAVAAAMLVVAGLVAVACAPLLTGERVVPRDRVDPELVVAARTSPLAGYREWKTDARIDAPLFTVAGDGRLPERLRIAVLDAYDGVEFHVSANAAGRFTRFPSGANLPQPVPVTVEIAAEYAGIWAPTAPLASAPEFFGPRADQLADAFYVNRATGAAIAVPGDPGREGLAAGDGYRAQMSAAPGGELRGGPASAEPLVELGTLPELDAWVRAQQLPATGAGLAELIERLRARGYLSHAMSPDDREWITRLAASEGTRFEPSVGGHSAARVEQLFEQLNTRQRAAGDAAGQAQLVAAVGDDEQFAAAAALLARALGFESRVVLGVRLGEGVPGVPACAATCTGEHVAAWIEVRGEAGEWVALDATPQATLPPNARAEGEQLPEFPTTPEERDAREVDPPLGFGERSDAAEDAEPTSEAPGWWPAVRVGLLSAAALALLALPLSVLPVAKRLRARRRRREPVPELRALGAWYELVDRAADAGVRLPAATNRGDVAAALGTALGTPHAARIAAEVDRAVFAPERFAAADADRLWALLDEIEALRGGGVRGRLRRAFALRSLGVRFAGRGVRERARAKPAGGAVVRRAHTS